MPTASAYRSKNSSIIDNDCHVDNKDEFYGWRCKNVILKYCKIFLRTQCRIFFPRYNWVRSSFITSLYDMVILMKEKLLAQKKLFS